MLISYKWLEDFLNLEGFTPEEIADKLSRTGLEVEGIENIGQGLNHLVVAYVESIEPHPDSDHLHITHLNDGSESLRQVVCGAPNIDKGQKVILAMPGAVLPGNFNIQESEIRGVASQGMICSLQELGFSENVVPKEYAKGIYVLPEEAPIGENVVDYLQLDDGVLDIDVTPNRADALSVLGNVYELGAILNQTPVIESQELKLKDNVELLEGVSVEVEETQLAPAYQLRLITDVTIAESPVWLQIRLMKAGIRPINNVVDVTNYYLLKYGQPMHAFDFDRLVSKDIHVQYAKAGETFTTLDGLDRKLTSDDVLIVAGETPVALAGVMGGLDSEVTKETRNVLLETAVFNPTHVRLTSKRLSLRSESSARFEKGINHDTVSESGAEAAHLIGELSGGSVIRGVKEYNQLNPVPVNVRVANDALKHKIGIDLSPNEIEEIIHRLGFEVSFEEDSYTVKVPPRRWDIQIEADILEEIARIYGYDNIPMTIPQTANIGRLTQKQKLVRHSRQICESLGLNQVISYALTSPQMANLIKSDNYYFVELDFPMSEDRSILRQSMFPALIEIAQYNQARQNKNLAFYEQGRVFLGQGSDQQPIEAERLAILLSGEKNPPTWYGEQDRYDFYDLKGAIETYLEALRLSGKLTFLSNRTIDVMHPGRTADIMLNGVKIGFLGQIHPKICKRFDLSDASFYAELDFDLLINHERIELIQESIPKFPSTSRDLAIMVNQSQCHQELVEIIQEAATTDLVSVTLFDYYDGDKIEVGKKSLAYHLVFQNPQRTLEDKDIEGIMEGITQSLLKIDELQIR